VIVAAAVSAVAGVSIFAFFLIPQQRFRHALHVYESSVFLFEVEGYFGAGVDRKSLYYWTETPMGVVRDYYEKYYPTFISRNQLLFTAINIDGSYPDGYLTTRFTSTGTFCEYTQTDACIQLTLMNLDLVDVNALSAIAPPSYRNISPFSIPDVPSTGTLIIYDYFVHCLFC
jgi:hypothetical protein